MDYPPISVDQSGLENCTSGFSLPCFTVPHYLMMGTPDYNRILMLIKEEALTAPLAFSQ